MKRMLAATVAMLVPVSPAIAQTAPVAQGAPAAPALDPARLSAARNVVGRLLPQGIYKRILGTTMNSMMDSMMGSMGKLPVREIVRMTGISEADANSLGEGTMDEVMEIYDPHWQERMQLTMHAVIDAMSDMMVSMEPKVRDALGRAYAREFTLAELQDMDRFFASPTGARYAGKSMELFMDPEMMKTMTEAMPEIMKQMPAIMAKAMSATKDLPKPRTNKDLTPAERKKLAGLLGIDAKKLETNSSDDQTQ
ncbi:MAG: DUF2059 domain-containing protein [Sphingomonas sp.]